MLCATSSVERWATRTRTAGRGAQGKHGLEPEHRWRVPQRRTHEGSSISIRPARPPPFETPGFAASKAQPAPPAAAATAAPSHGAAGPTPRVAAPRIGGGRALPAPDRPYSPAPSAPSSTPPSKRREPASRFAGRSPAPAWTPSIRFSCSTSWAPSPTRPAPRAARPTTPTAASRPSPTCSTARQSTPTPRGTRGPWARETCNG